MPVEKHIDTIYSEACQVIESGQAAAYRAVNKNMVETYWKLGQLIVEEEQAGKERAKYGQYLIKELSKRLTSAYGEGYDKRNLFYMKQFYSTYPIVNALRSQLTWTHYRLLLKVKDPKARQFYEDESIKNGWITRALDRQINAFYYERLLSSRDKSAVEAEAQEKTASLTITPLDFVKDPYVLEFLNIKPGYKLYEEDLEQLLIDNLQEFLLELGRGFSFVSRQKYIRADGEDFFIDLVFYNYLLKCFVLIDLKIGRLRHQDIGQMDMYVRMYEDLYKIEGDNPTIGIILCSEKSEAVAKYSILSDGQQIFASKYLLYLPTEEELKAELERERVIADLKLQRPLE